MTIQERPRRQCTLHSVCYKDYSEEDSTHHGGSAEKEEDIQSKKVKTMAIQERPRRQCTLRSVCYKDDSEDSTHHGKNSDFTPRRPFKGHNSSTGSAEKEEDIGDHDHPISSPSITTAELAISELNSPVSAMTSDSPPTSSSGGTVVAKRRGAAERIVSNSVNVDDLARTALTVIKNYNLLLVEEEDRERFQKVIVELVLGEYKAHHSALINGTDTASVRERFDTTNLVGLDSQIDPLTNNESDSHSSNDSASGEIGTEQQQDETGGNFSEREHDAFEKNYLDGLTYAFNEIELDPHPRSFINWTDKTTNSPAQEEPAIPMLRENTPDHGPTESPLNRDVSLNFSFPDVQGHSELLTTLKKVNEKLETNWESLKNMIENKKDRNFGGSIIQSERYMISLTFGEDFTKCKCWQKFCSKIEFEEGVTMMKSILQFAKQKSEDLMGDKFSEGKLETPALIICETMEDQGFHLDIVGKDQKQFCMLLSTGSSSTIIAEPDNTENVSTYQEVTNLIVDEIKNYGFDWLEPCTELLEKIHGIDIDDDESASGSKMNAGFGNLFKIHKRPQGRIYGGKSYQVVNCPAGTCFAMDGGEIHAGAGSNKGQIRTCLFWTWSDKNGMSYDKDVQETRLSMMIHIANDCWDDLEGEDERMGMMKMIYYCFITSEVSYRKSAPPTFCDPSVEKFLEDLNSNGAEEDADKVLKLLRDHAEKLFQEVEDEI